MLEELFIILILNLSFYHKVIYTMDYYITQSVSFYWGKQFGMNDLPGIIFVIKDVMIVCH